MLSKINQMAKLELHSHIEGTVSPDMARLLFSRHNMPIPKNLFTASGEYNWVSFETFVKETFDSVASAVKTEEDYYDITYNYLKKISSENCIYTELFVSPSAMSNLNGLSCEEILKGMSQAIADIKKHIEIDARIIITFVRHLDLGISENEIRFFENNIHKYPYVTGFNIAGAEREDDIYRYSKLFKRAKDIGMGITAHAGEACGPQSIHNLLEAVPFVTRIGHGVRAIEDKILIEKIVERNITLEVCPTSNLRLGIYSDYKEHPLKELISRGVRVTINSDDPPFFGTSIGNEYEISFKEIGLSYEDLYQANLNAIHAAFVDKETKNTLLKKIKN